MLVDGECVPVGAAWFGAGAYLDVAGEEPVIGDNADLYHIGPFVKQAARQDQRL